MKANKTGFNPAVPNSSSSTDYSRINERTNGLNQIQFIREPMPQEGVLDEEGGDVQILLRRGAIVHSIAQQLLHNHRVQHQTTVLHLPTTEERS